MAKTDKEKEVIAKEIAPKAVASLAFRVVPDNDGLYAAEMVLLEGDKVLAKRRGLMTTLGHAIGAADDLMDGWAFSEIETTAEDYFTSVYL